jgi:hypothetical protein
MALNYLAFITYQHIDQKASIGNHITDHMIFIISYYSNLMVFRSHLMKLFPKVSNQKLSDYCIYYLILQVFSFQMRLTFLIHCQDL